MTGKYFRVLYFTEMIAHGWWLTSGTTSLDVKEMVFFILIKDGNLILVRFLLLASVCFL